MGRRPRNPQGNRSPPLSKSDKPVAPSTRAVLAGRREEWTGPVVNPPVWRASTHLYATEGDRIASLAHNEDGHFHYGRRGAPTQWALAEALTQLEPGADGTMLYPSGTAALAGALMSVLEPGDVLLVQDNVYEPTRAIASGLLKRWGVEARFFDPADHDAFAALFDERTSAVMLETPGSLTMEVPDIPSLAAIARDHAASVLVDNTWATGLGFPALEHGCDITITALTKHAGGHSDVMMGAASANAKYYAKLRHTAQSLGQCVSPDDAALVSRGLRTVPLRLHKSSESALKVAQWLHKRTEVAHVLCPMLEGSPGHDLWTRDFTGGCGLFSFVLAGHTSDQRAAFVDSLDLFGIGYSWGGFESLALPFDAARIRSASAWPKSGWREEDHLGVRLAIGLEDADDLIADLDRAFAAIKHS
ncbi:cystathionine beta-lyase [Alteriqipengyuania lutimaris]|uniref:Cystathionine beta-lyase n=1 Tax=Alteriqipengyuania lutimaris TaxID=1538146 RepID=A0A395LPV7_9SPHN|nr:cystathionine beta-lyase [Alteriqipengyuania lutimaris]MBB3033370.1 cystathionine beta-lyase [Alteriqipengyuania lutimaris]RDS77604.1 cystathionine beta-lyase [Alteriqipengyuania lutimaris]